MSSKKKLFAIIATVAMLAGMLAFGAVPAIAGSGSAVALTVPNVTQATGTGAALGTILIGGIPGSDQITLTLPAGVSWAGTEPTTGTSITAPADIPNTSNTNGFALSSGSAITSAAITGVTNAVYSQGVVATNNSGGSPLVVTESGSMMSIAATGNNSGDTGSLLITPYLNYTSASTGPINITITDTTAAISGTVTVANIVSGGTVTTVNSTASMAPNGQDSTSIMLQENSVGALRGGSTAGSVHFDLPANFVWGTPTISLTGGWNGWGYSSTASPAAGAIGYQILTNSSGNSSLHLYFGSSTTTAPGTMQISVPVEAQYDATTGTIVASLGGTNLGLSGASLTVGTCATYGLTATVTSPKTLFSGTFDDTLPQITLTEGVADTLIQGRILSLTLPSGVTWDGTNYPTTSTQSGSASLTATTTPVSTDKSTVTYTIGNAQNGSGSTITLSAGQVDVSPTAGTGNVTLSISGSGVSTTVVVAKVVSSVTATASAAPTVTSGGQNQAVGDVTITEGAAGAIVAQTSGYGADHLALYAPPGSYFNTPAPTVAVTSGNMVITGSPSIGGTASNEIDIPIANGSTVASTIKVSGIAMTFTPGVASGPVVLNVGGSSLVDQRLGSTTNYVTSATVANVGTGTAAGGSVAFTIGATVYSVGGVQSVMDVAPFIQNGRTYVPVRYLANALGVPDSGIVWDATTQTVTLTSGSTTVVLTIGSTTETVNGTATTMDVAPQIVNGRTMLPARFVATALGYQVGWNPATQEVLISK